MAQNPDKSQKQKRKQRKNKQKALQSFLVVQKSDPSPVSDLASTNLSDQQEKPKPFDDSFCSICEADLGQKKRNCGFCNFPACSDHMRKKRKNKEQNKWVRICDNCEDRYLYSKYMKLELKNQESIAVHQTIVEAARDQIAVKAKEKRDIMAKHRAKENEILAKRKQQETKWEQELSEYKSKVDKLESNLSQLDKLQAELKQTEAKLPPDLKQDYATLQLQSERVKKQILKYEKLCFEASNVKSKRQKQIYEEYNRWESTQRARLSQKEKQECCIF